LIYLDFLLNFELLLISEGICWLFWELHTSLPCLGLAVILIVEVFKGEMEDYGGFYFLANMACFPLMF
jgi:hypothetical protein